jgi:protein gp37
MADVFDNKVPTPWRVDLWSLIRSTPALDWFLLTKRPRNIRDMLPTDWGEGWPQVWLGATTENQEEANRRIPHLVAIPAAVGFLSVEPMLEPVDVAPWLVLPSYNGRAPISWIIVGGESGGGARPMHPDWVRAARHHPAGGAERSAFSQPRGRRVLSVGSAIGEIASRPTAAWRGLVRPVINCRADRQYCGT